MDQFGPVLVYVLRRVSRALTRGCTAHGRLRGGGVGWSEVEVSGGLHGGLECQAKVHGFGLEYCR